MPRFAPHSVLLSAVLVMPGCLTAFTAGWLFDRSDDGTSGEWVDTGLRFDTGSWRDWDGDGYGVDEDCNDGDPEVHPRAPEICDGVDQDCDAEVDEGACSDTGDTGDTDTGDTGDTGPSDTDTGDTDTGDTGRGDTDTGDPDTADTDTGDTGPGDTAVVDTADAADTADGG